MDKLKTAEQHNREAGVATTGKETPQTAKDIRSMRQFTERYLPFIAMAEKAIAMSSKGFALWYIGLTEEQQDKVHDAMLSMANEYQRKARHIYNLLGY